METIDYKQKIKDYMNSSEVDTLYKSMLKNLFPELKESEDERIRKAIKKALQVRCDGSRIISDEPVTLEEALAWLEKQCGKGTNGNERKISIPEPPLTIKHAKEVMGIKQDDAWSEEDEKCIENAIMYCEWARDIAPNLHCYETSEKSINWLKSLKDRVLPQPKQEWSKEDKVMLDEIIDFFENGTVKLQHDLSLYASWLKSIRPQSTWKPSKEQMMAKAVDGVVTFDYYEGDKAYGCVAHDSFCLEDLELKDMDEVKILILKKNKEL